MPNWQETLTELNTLGSTEDMNTLGSTEDITRRKYLRKLNRLTHRNVIAYYSGWLQQAQPSQGTALDDSDKIGFMNAVHKLRSITQ